MVVLENHKFSGEEMIEMVNLPSKKDLIARLCQVLMEPATRLARVLQAVADKYSTTFDESLPEKMAELEEWLATIRSAEDEPDEEESEEADLTPEEVAALEAEDEDYPLVVEPYEEGTMGALAAFVARGGVKAPPPPTAAGAPTAPAVKPEAEAPKEAPEPAPVV